MCVTVQATSNYKLTNPSIELLGFNQLIKDLESLLQMVVKYWPTCADSQEMASSENSRNPVYRTVYVWGESKSEEYEKLPKLREREKERERIYK